MPEVVCNSTPLIHLSKAGRLYLLKDFFQEILVPKEVLVETIVNGNGSPYAREIEKSDWIRPIAIRDANLETALKLILDDDESAVIVLALEQNADLVLMDDYDGRAVAAEYSLRVAGTIGLLLKAKYEGKIVSLGHELDILKEGGFWLSEGLYQRFLKEAGEI
ncbi:Uncharacterised protein [uncultured archaeon]|nr:Uncharacterised protein [uncultured archaeon]